jgi:hypothetical protein
MSKKTKLPTIKTTPFGELRFPKVTNPDTDGKFADGKFKTYLILDGADHDAVAQALSDAAESAEFKAFFKANGVVAGSDAILQLPRKEFKNKDSGEVEEVGFNFKSKYRPAVFDARKTKLPATAKIGNGTEARIGATIFPWTKSEKVREKVNGKVIEKTETGYGVSMRFDSMQIRKLVEGGGASDGSEFEDDVEGFEYNASDNGSDETAGQFDL